MRLRCWRWASNASPSPHIMAPSSTMRSSAILHGSTSRELCWEDFIEGRQEALYTTSLRALDEVSYMQVYQYCKSGYQSLKQPVDAIYINGGGWDAPPAIDLLERDLGTKVVFALAAEMWATYKRLAIELSVADCGALLRGNFALPPRP